MTVPVVAVFMRVVVAVPVLRMVMVVFVVVAASMTEKLAPSWSSSCSQRMVPSAARRWLTALTVAWVESASTSS